MSDQRPKTLSGRLELVVDQVEKAKKAPLLSKSAEFEKVLDGLMGVVQDMAAIMDNSIDEVPF